MGVIYLGRKPQKHIHTKYIEIGPPQQVVTIYISHIEAGLGLSARSLIFYLNDFPSYSNCYIGLEPCLQTGSQVQNFCVDFKLLEQVYLSRPPTFCENAPFMTPVMVLWETCTLI